MSLTFSSRNATLAATTVCCAAALVNLAWVSKSRRGSGARQRTSLVSGSPKSASRLCSADSGSCSDAETSAAEGSDAVSRGNSHSTCSEQSSPQDSDDIRIAADDDDARSDTSCSDIDAWHDPGETLILFDWDDTLCPTTARCSADAEALARHAYLAEQVLRLAAECGRVEVVTMATPSWLEESLRTLVPRLRVVLEELGIPVRYAREGLPPWQQREAQAEGREEAQYMKRRMMARVAKRFYRARHLRPGARRPAQRSWKNIISIGDSWSERNALQEVVLGRMQRDRHGRWKECRCKVVKLKSEPTVTELSAQLLTIGEALPAFAHHDGDLDIELRDADLAGAYAAIGQL